jgi:hypothetical protein
MTHRQRASRCLDLLQRRNVSARIETMVVNEAPPESPEDGSEACDCSQLESSIGAASRDLRVRNSPRI